MASRPQKCRVLGHLLKGRLPPRFPLAWCPEWAGKSDSVIKFHWVMKSPLHLLTGPAVLLLSPVGGQTCLRRGLQKALAQRTLFSVPSAAVGFSRGSRKKPASSQARYQTRQG